MSAIKQRISSPAAVHSDIGGGGTQRSALEHRFYSGFAIAIGVAVFLGFSRSFFLKPVLFPDFPAPPEPVFAIHGIVFSAWLLLFIAQTSLIARGNVRGHRSLGVLGAALAIAMLPLGMYVGLVAAHRPGGFIGIPIPPLQFLVVPLAGIALFALFVGLAIARRRDPQAHKRMMLLGTLQMATPGIARWPGLAPFGPLAFFGITDLFLIALAIFDWRTRGRLHPVTRWGGILTIVSQPTQLFISGSAPWLGFARWATGLLG